MAAGSFNVYDVWKNEMGGAGVDMNSATLYGVIVSAGYTPALATDLSASANFPDMSAVAGQLSATFKALSTITWSATGSNTYQFDCDDITFTYSVATHSKYFVVFRKSDNKLVCYCDLDTGASTGVEGTKLIVQMPSAGLFTLS